MKLGSGLSSSMSDLIPQSGIGAEITQACTEEEVVLLL